MILRRYGTTVQSVDIDFNSRALNEVGFRRDRVFSLPFEDFDTGFESVSTHTLSAEAEGDVQDEVEQSMLDDLEAQLRDVLDSRAEAEVLFVESSQDTGYPKTRTRTQNVIVEGENRLYFYSSIDQPLQVGVYRRV